MTPELIAEMHDLREQGYSIREIAAELDVTKSAVERGLKLMPHSDRPTMAGTPKPSANPLSGNVPAKTTPGELDKQREHEREMKKLDIQERELALRERELSGKQPLSGFVISPPTDTPERESKRTEKRKIMFVDKFNALVEELLDNTQDATWDTKEIDQLLDRAEFLRQQIRLFCDANDTDEEGLKIWYSLKQFTTYLEGMRSSANDRNRIKWHNEPDEDAIIQAWTVGNFSDLRGTKSETDLLADVNQIIRHFQEHCQQEWTKAEVNDFTEFVEEIKQEIADFCEENAIDTDELLVTARLDELLTILNAACVRDRKAKTITFGYTDEQEKSLDSLLVKDFNDTTDDEEDDETSLAGTDEEKSGSGGLGLILGLGAAAVILSR